MRHKILAISASFFIGFALFFVGAYMIGPRLEGYYFLVLAILPVLALISAIVFKNKALLNFLAIFSRSLLFLVLFIYLWLAPGSYNECYDFYRCTKKYTSEVILAYPILGFVVINTLTLYLANKKKTAL